MKKIQISKNEKTKIYNNFFKDKFTGILLLEDGTKFYGYGYGFEGFKIGELCFNTSMTGYQEILTDPSYKSQIIVFTFPHIGNVGYNSLDNESNKVFSFGLITREDISSPSNWRSKGNFNEWLKSNKVIGISGIDTRSLTKIIRSEKAPKALICYSSDGIFDEKAYLQSIRIWKGINNLELTSKVSVSKNYNYNYKLWDFKKNDYLDNNIYKYHIVAFDFGIKLNILRFFNENKCKVTVIPYNSDIKTIKKLQPDGIFLSNGPGDPFATYKIIKTTLKFLLDLKIPIFGICLGHQLLAILLGAKTQKMDVGHRGANHPVINLENNRVEITSQNHGFVVLDKDLPENLKITHRSLFDGSIEGLRDRKNKIFSVQYHPESSPGPQDSSYLFKNFIKMI